MQFRVFIDRVVDPRDEITRFKLSEMILIRLSTNVPALPGFPVTLRRALG
jgi:hypothetical protein